MHLVTSDKKDPDEGPMLLFKVLSEALAGLFGKGTDPAQQCVGMVILTYFLNPFGLIPPVRPDTKLFGDVRRFGGYLDAAHRGGLFRRGDE